MFLRFPLCLFLFFFFYFFFLRLTGRTLVRLHHMPPSPLAPWRETRPLLLKVTPASSPPAPGSGGSLGLSSPGPCGCSAGGASARLCLGTPLPAPIPVLLPLPPRLAALPFLGEGGRGGRLPGVGGCSAPPPCPPAHRVRCK